MVETVLTVSFGCSFVILLLLLTVRPASARLRTGWRRYGWLLIAVRLLLPWNPALLPARALLFDTNLPVVRWNTPSEELSGAQRAAYGEPESAARPDPGAAPSGDAPASGQTPELPERSAPVQDTSAPDGASPASGRFFGTLTLHTLLTAVWLTGAAVFLLVETARYLRFLRLIRRWARPIRSDRASAVFREVAAETHADVRLSLAVCPGVGSPMITGFVRPVLLLPDENLPEDELRLLFQHELYHHSRRDVLYKLLLTLANAVHWFNPLVWLMVRRAGQDIELCCDEAVVRPLDDVERARYAEALLSAAKGRRGPAVLSTDFTGGARKLRERMERLFDRRPRGDGGWALALTACLLLLSCALTACVRPGTASDPSDAQAHSVPSEASSSSSSSASSHASESEKVSGTGYGGAASSETSASSEASGTSASSDSSALQPAETAFRVSEGFKWGLSPIWDDPSAISDGGERDLEWLRDALLNCIPENLTRLSVRAAYSGEECSRSLTADEVERLCLMLRTFRPYVREPVQEENPPTGSAATAVTWSTPDGSTYELCVCWPGVGVAVGNQTLWFSLDGDGGLAMYVDRLLHDRGQRPHVEIPGQTSPSGLHPLTRLVYELYALDPDAMTASPFGAEDCWSVCALLESCRMSSEPSGREGELAFLAICADNYGGTERHYLYTDGPVPDTLREMFRNALRSGTRIPRWLVHFNPAKLTDASFDQDASVLYYTAAAEKLDLISDALRGFRVDGGSYAETRTDPANAVYKLWLTFSTGVTYTLWSDGETAYLVSSDLAGECRYVPSEGSWERLLALQNRIGRGDD